MAIRDTVARLISGVYSDKLHPRIAAGLAPLMHLQLRVLEKTEFEKRLARVERLLRDSMAANLKASGRKSGAYKGPAGSRQGMRQSRWLYATEIMA
jgi:hypothetical protein